MSGLLNFNRLSLRNNRLFLCILEYLLVSHLIVVDVPSRNHLVRTSVWCTSVLDWITLCLFNECRIQQILNKEHS